MNVSLTWQSVPGITTQLVQYQIAGSSSWTDYKYVDLLLNSVTIPNLLDNYIYNFRVATECSTGSRTPSSLSSVINIVCPTVTCTSAGSTVSYSFPALKASITGYTVNLYNNAGTSILATQTPSFTSTTNTITGTFSGLSSATGYKVELTITADTFTKTCSKVSITTTGAAACDTPQSVTALIY